MCDDALVKTSHIVRHNKNKVYTSWTENNGVHAYEDNPRSTSVGDYMMIDGQGWSCENHGWSKI